MSAALRNAIRNLDQRIQLVFIGLLVGVFSGFAALGLNLALESAHGALSRLGGAGLYLILPAVGIVLTVIFLRYLVRDASGHGVPEVIFSLSARGGRMSRRTGFSRLVASFRRARGAGGDFRRGHRLWYRRMASLQ